MAERERKNICRETTFDIQHRHSSNTKQISNDIWLLPYLFSRRHQRHPFDGVFLIYFTSTSNDIYREEIYFFKEKKNTKRHFSSIFVNIQVNPCGIVSLSSLRYRPMLIIVVPMDWNSLENLSMTMINASFDRTTIY